MTTVFQPKLAIPEGACAPDVYDEATGSRPAPTQVVSRNLDGEVASTYGDLTWDLTAYHPERRPTKLSFSFWANKAPTASQFALVDETHWIMFSLMWRLSGPPLSIGTLDNYGVVLRALASFAQSQRCSVGELLVSAPLLLEFVGERRSNRAKLVSALTGKLGRLGFTVVGDTARAQLMARHRKYAESLQQVAPMPTRIYSSVLAALAKELSEWSIVAPKFLAMASRLAEDPFLGRSYGSQWKTSKAIGVPFEKVRDTFDVVAQHHGVVDYFNEKALPHNVRGALSGLADVQLVAKLMIQAFTGMRDDEAESLPYDCLEIVRSDGVSHHLVNGRTTKFNHGQAKRVRWVTSLEGARAIRIAQDIAAAVYDLQPGRADDERLLFINPSYMGVSGKPRLATGQGRARKLELASQPAVRERLQPIIDDSDLRELEQIDPHRAWRAEEKFTVGQPWGLVSHQFRRSLALYAQRSGIVSLPSLRRQLQHITDEMSRYYARGSSFAKDFLDANPDHFGYEWQDTAQESSALGYIFSVLMARAAMTGGHGAWSSTACEAPTEQSYSTVKRPSRCSNAGK